MSLMNVNARSQRVNNKRMSEYENTAWCAAVKVAGYILFATRSASLSWKGDSASLPTRAGGKHSALSILLR